MHMIIALVVLLLASTTHASELPEAERTADAKRWLAVAFVAEAGWKAADDHRGIYHVLARRWQRRVKRYPNLTFTKMVQNYVAAFDSRAAKGGRVRWLLSLVPRRVGAPAGWPRKLSWPKHSVWWLETQERAARCVDGGRCRDPYPKALHWGGEMDLKRGCMIELPNVGAANTFYSVDMACRRRAIKARRSS